MGALDYSFSDHKKYRLEYPVHSLRVYGKYDVGKVGESFVGDENILASLFSRTDDRNAIYQKEAGLIYRNEFYSGLSYSTEFLHKTSYATWLTQFDRYNADGSYSPIDKYTMATLKFSLRYSKDEEFFQARRFRYSMNKEHPVWLLTHTVGLKGVLGSDYTYNRTEASYEQRFWLSYFGYVDVFLKATKVWNNVPYTLLDVPDASCSYTMKTNAFSLLDPVEFICNQSLTWDISYFMNGLIMNRIPVLNKLRLREFLTFKGVWGDLYDKSNPYVTANPDGLFVLPDYIKPLKKGVGKINDKISSFSACSSTFECCIFLETTNKKEVTSHENAVGDGRSSADGICGFGARVRLDGCGR